MAIFINQTDPLYSLRNNLVYHIDAGNKNSYPQSGTIVNDFGKYRRSSTLGNVTLATVSGVQAFSFNNTNSIITTNVDSTGITLPVTFNFWIYNNSAATLTAGLYDTSPSTLTNYTANSFRSSTYQSGDPQFWRNNAFTWTGPAAQSDPYGAAVSVSNSWYNISIVYSIVSTFRTVKVYNNGSLSTTTTGTANPGFAWNNLQLGRINEGALINYNGYIAICQIFAGLEPTAEQLGTHFNLMKNRFSI